MRRPRRPSSSAISSRRSSAAPVLREYLRKTPVTKAYFDAGADSPLEDFAAEAPRHPVFRIAT